MLKPRRISRPRPAFPQKLAGYKGERLYRIIVSKEKKLDNGRNRNATQP